jgi:hypothetical protein
MIASGILAAFIEISITASAHASMAGSMVAGFMVVGSMAAGSMAAGAAGMAGTADRYLTY